MSGWIYGIGLIFGYTIGKGPIAHEWAAWLLIALGAFVSWGIDREVNRGRIKKQNNIDADDTAELEEESPKRNHKGEQNLPGTARNSESMRPK